MSTDHRIEIDNPASYRGTPFKYLIAFQARDPRLAPVFKQGFWNKTKLLAGTVVLSRSSAIRGMEDITQIERELEQHFKRKGRLVSGMLRRNIMVTGFSRFED